MNDRLRRLQLRPIVAAAAVFGDSTDACYGIRTDCQILPSPASATGHAYDVLETKGRNGDAVTFYFLIDRVLAAEAKELAPKR